MSLKSSRTFVSKCAAFSLIPLLAISMFASPILADDDDRRGPKVRKVDCDKNGKTIQKKIDKAKIGEVIKVKGNCVENLLITTDQLVIDGGGTASITPSDTGVATVTIQATNVRISGFSIVAGTTRQGVIISNGGSGIVSGNDISSETGDSTGVLVTSNSYGLIGGTIAARGNAIHGHSRGVTIRNGSGSDIFFNTISGNERGISVISNGSADITDNDIIGSDRGINLFTGGVVSFSAASGTSGGNTFIDNATAIRCRFGGSASGGNPALPQIDGGGNGTLLDISTSTGASGCHVVSSVFFVLPPP